MSTARPPKAPPLTSMPSTPGPQVPGGYPRNSVVFSANQWDRAPPQTQSQTEAKTGFLAATKAYLPPAVASYFPTQSSNTTSSSSDYLSPAAHAHSAGHTPGVALHTDGSTSAASDFSTRAYAGSGSSRRTLTPTQGHGDFPTESDASSTSNTSGVDSSANSDPDQHRTSTATPTTVESTPGPEARRVDPLPSVAPFANVLTAAVARPAPAPAPQPNSTHALDQPAVTMTPASPASSGSGFSSTSAASASTAPSSPCSPAPHTKFVLSPMPSSPASHEKGFSASVKRFASLRRRGEKGKAAPPSAFGGAGHVRGGSLDTATASGADSPDDAHPHVHFDTAAPTEKPSRRASLLRTLRGEASVLAGRVRGDRERVERGRRMIHGEV